MGEDAVTSDVKSLGKSIDIVHAEDKDRAKFFKSGSYLYLRR